MASRRLWRLPLSIALGLALLWLALDALWSLAAAAVAAWVAPWL